MSHMLKPLCILHFGFLYDTIPWALEKSKNETTAAREVVVKLNLSFLTAISWYDVATFLSISWIIFLKILFYFISVNLEAWFSIFLVSYEPKYTQIDLTRQLTSTNIFPVGGQFFLFFYIYTQCYMNTDLNFGQFNNWYVSRIQKTIPFLYS